MKTIILITLMIFALNKIDAQVSQEWVRTYNGTGNSIDELNSMVRDNQNNIIVTGRSVSTGINHDFGTVKYNSSGQLQWAAAYNGVANDYDEAVALAVDNSGNVYVAGHVRDSTSYYDIAVIKYDPAGVQQWVKLWSGSSGRSDYASDIAVDNSGNVYVTGSSDGISGTSYVTVKHNSSGNFLWARLYNYSSNMVALASHIRADNSGNCYVTGTSSAPGSGSDFLTIKYNSNGDSSWSARYNGTTASNEIPQGFEIDNAGNVYVTGFTTGTNSGVDYMTIKYNNSGVQQWATRYTSNGVSQDIPEDLKVDAAGNVYVTGRTRVSSSYNDIGTVKYNSSGVMQWLALYDNPAFNRDDDPHSIAVDAEGNVYVTGYSNTGSDGNAITLKYDNSGNPKWAVTYSGSDASETFAVLVDADHNVYIAGTADDLNADYLVIKYSQTIGINQISNEVPSGINLRQNYPNPFNPSTKITFEIPSFGVDRESQVKMIVYNSLGEEVAVPVNERLQPGSYEVPFEGSKLSSGVYFYKLDVNGHSQTRQMVLLK